MRKIIHMLPRLIKIHGFILVNKSLVLGSQTCQIVNGIKACWLWGLAFSCLVTLLDAVLRVVCPTIKALILNFISGETPVKFIHACCPTHLYTWTSLGLSADLSSCGLDKKFTDAHFFTNTPYDELHAPQRYSDKPYNKHITSYQ